jgi:predicted aldo/keto reductase-like oxidoreductase
MQYRKDKHGEDLSVMGFGCMRFQKKGTGIDMEKAEQQIMEAIDLGINYFDTAYVYSGSEAAIGEIFEKNHVRKKIKIATKLPQYLIGSNAALDKFFKEELSRLRTDYVDYYLMHHLTDVAMWEKLKNVGVREWLDEKKKSGAIRNVGFSYHGNSDGFLKILNDYDWDMCQIQYNYFDENSQAGVVGLKAAAEKGIPVVIMEPLRGGKLEYASGYGQESDEGKRKRLEPCRMELPLALQPTGSDGGSVRNEHLGNGAGKLQDRRSGPGGRIYGERF